MMSGLHKKQNLSLRWRLVSISIAALLPTVAVLLLNEAALRRAERRRLHEASGRKVDFRVAKVGRTEAGDVHAHVAGAVDGEAEIDDGQCRSARERPRYQRALGRSSEEHPRKATSHHFAV
jgi:hypothetical protein